MINFLVDATAVHVYSGLIFGFAKVCGYVCWIPSPWGELDVKGMLESSCVVVAARAPWIWPIPSRRCNTDSLNIGLG